MTLQHSGFANTQRASGMPVRESIMHGAELRVRPVVMTSLTAALGLLPAALAESIGSQAQKPLAIVVVGGMLVTLFLTRYLMPVLYSFFPAPASHHHDHEADLLIEGRLLVELKSVERLSPLHGKQVLTYLRLLDMPLGLLINFGGETFKEGVKRIVNNHRR